MYGTGLPRSTAADGVEPHGLLPRQLFPLTTNRADQFEGDSKYFVLKGDSFCTMKQTSV